MAGPRQRGRAKRTREKRERDKQAGRGGFGSRGGEKRSYAKKDPTITKSWDKYWKDDAADLAAIGMGPDEEWDKSIRLGNIPQEMWEREEGESIPLGFWKKDLATGKFESGQDYVPDMRDYTRRMTLQDIMGPPIHDVVDPNYKRFQQEFFDVTQDIDKTYPGFKDFRNKINLRNYLIEPALEGGNVMGQQWGVPGTTFGMQTIAPERFEHYSSDYSDLSGILGKYSRQGILANRGWNEYADAATGKFTTSTGWKGSDYYKYRHAPGTVWHEVLHGALDMPNEERAIREFLDRAGIEQDVDIMHELGYRPEQMTPVDTSEVYNQLGISPRPVLTGIASLPTNGVFY